jgi:hypothetical protein
MPTRSRIIHNRAKCLVCGDVVESTHRHDYRSCSCGKVAVDGGHEYLRRVGDSHLLEELSEVVAVDDDESEEDRRARDYGRQTGE